MSSRIALLFIIPFAILSSLWQLDGFDLDYGVVPLLGLGVIMSGASSAVVLSRWYSLDRKQFSAVLPVMSFYNLGALGALFAFFFFGEDGVALLALFKLFEEVVYFGVIFPFCRSNGSEQSSKASRFWKNPVFIVSSAALATGVLLGGNGIARPEFFSVVTQYLIPLGSLLLVFAAGLTFHIQGAEQWIGFSAVAAVLRILMGCLFVTVTFWLFDLWTLGDGTLYAVCLMLACMPCGFIGVLPARLYGLDAALANTTWLATYIVSLLVGGSSILWW
ncbi:hypothetical protein ACPV4B_09980 [Vibrio parahaemolyticus]|uniref:hypothetical protein n=1 Tax=Vibrio mediterranei TaxID=689 RepID=UPI0040697024